MSANNNNRLKVFVKDVPNINKTFIPGQGTVMEVPRAENNDTVGEICEALETGTIGTANVTSTPVAKVLMRFVVNHKMQQAAPKNGQRANQIQVIMTDAIASLAQNVTSVKRTTESLWTMGGVTTQKEFQSGMNLLLNTVGPRAFGLLHEVHATLHAYASGDGAAQQVAEAALTTNCQDLRDALCAKLQSPQDVRNRIDQLTTSMGEQRFLIEQQRATLAQNKCAIMERDNTIRMNDDTIQKKDQIIESLQNTIRTLQNQNRSNKRPRTESRAESDAESEDQEEPKKDNDQPQPSGNVISPTQQPRGG